MGLEGSPIFGLIDAAVRDPQSFSIKIKLNICTDNIGLRGGTFTWFIFDFDDRILLNSKEVHSVENQKAEMIEERVKVIHHNFWDA